MAEPLLVTSRFTVEDVQRELADGTRYARPVIRHPGAVTVLPLVDDDHVCLIRNYRVAVERTLIELPAGTLEPPEEPEQTAHRELIEETGFRAARLAPLHAFFMSPGILDERMHVFVATELQEVGAARETSEEIENLIVSWDEAMQLVHTGQIEDAKSLVALLMYDRVRSRS